MAWTLTALTPEDKTLVVDTLRKEAERRDKAASTSALQLVAGADDGRISTRAAKAVRQLHADAETLRSLAWDMEQQRDVPAVTPIEDVVEEERAATYPPLTAVDEVGVPSGDVLDALRVIGKGHSETPPKGARALRPSGPPRPAAKRAVKIVEFKDPIEESMSHHPANGPTQPQED